MSKHEGENDRPGLAIGLKGNAKPQQQSKGTLCSPNSHECATVFQENYMKGFFMVVQ